VASIGGVGKKVSKNKSWVFQNNKTSLKNQKKTNCEYLAEMGGLHLAERTAGRGGSWQLARNLRDPKFRQDRREGRIEIKCNSLVCINRFNMDSTLKRKFRGAGQKGRFAKGPERCEVREGEDGTIKIGGATVC